MEKKFKKLQKNIFFVYLEVSVSSGGALRRSAAAVGLVQEEAEDVEQEHDRHDEQVGEQALKKQSKKFLIHCRNIGNDEQVGEHSLQKQNKKCFNSLQEHR